MGLHMDLDRNVAAEFRRCLVEMQHWVGVVVVVVAVIVSNVHGCDLVRIKCSSYLCTQLFGKRLWGKI